MTTHGIKVTKTQSSDKNTSVTLKLELFPLSGQISLSEEEDTWTVMLAPCQRGRQEEGDE